MEKNMSRVQPQALTDEELMNYIYIQNYAVPVEFVQELWKRYAALLDAAEDDLK
jgi:hypothetical protein